MPLTIAARAQTPYRGLAIRFRPALRAEAAHPRPRRQVHGRNVARGDHPRLGHLHDSIGNAACLALEGIVGGAYRELALQQ